jgi:hypothetical protein
MIVQILRQRRGGKRPIQRQPLLMQQANPLLSMNNYTPFAPLLSQRN